LRQANAALGPPEGENPPFLGSEHTGLGVVVQKKCEHKAMCLNSATK